MVTVGRELRLGWACVLVLTLAIALVTAFNTRGCVERPNGKLVEVPRSECPDVPPHLGPLLAAAGLAVALSLSPRAGYRRAVRAMTIDKQLDPSSGRMVVVEPEKVVAAAIRSCHPPVRVECFGALPIAMIGYWLHLTGLSKLEAAPFFIVTLTLLAIGYPRMARFTKPIEELHAADVRLPS